MCLDRMSWEACREEDMHKHKHEGGNGDGGNGGKGGKLRLKEIFWDPVSRVAGDLAFYVKIDVDNRKVVDARSVAALFRGYEVILRGRDPRDAAMISSRACGVCGGVHSVTSVMAQEMAYGISPPPLAVAMRNMAAAAEMIYDHSTHMFLLAGPDYSTALTSKSFPSVVDEAKRTLAEYRDVHGFTKIIDIMDALNPLTGKLYLEALQVTRIAREMFSLMLGRYPHPSTLVPGGVTTTVTPDLFTNYLTRMIKVYDWAKIMALVWEDIINFWYNVKPEYEEVGRFSKVNLICGGIYDDPEIAESGDLYRYESAREWGEKRLVTPGVIKEGELITTDLVEINLGIEEYVEHAYYEQWNEKIVERDPLGNELTLHHPWNKVTLPKPGPLNWKEKYTWSTAPRWNRMVFETGGGPLARHWVTVLAKKLPENPFIRIKGDKLVMHVPKGANLPEMDLEWRIPKALNALERNRARAYHIAYVVGVGMHFLLKSLEYLRAGRTRVWTPHNIPKEGIGVGFYEAGRGFLTHHLVLRDHKIYNYQIITPSTWNASPRDPWGQPGPYEDAAMNTPILEETSTPDDITGLDVLRALRSFDPCMPCTVHMMVGNGKVLVRDVTTCSCSV